MKPLFRVRSLQSQFGVWLFFAQITTIPLTCSTFLTRIMWRACTSEVIGGEISHFPLFIGTKRVAKMAEPLVINVFFLMLLYWQPASYKHGQSAHFIIQYHLLCGSAASDGTQQTTARPPAHTVLRGTARCQIPKVVRASHISTQILPWTRSYHIWLWLFSNCIRGWLSFFLCLGVSVGFRRKSKAATPLLCHLQLANYGFQNY